MRIKVGLNPEWNEYQLALAALESKEAKKALAIATTKTAKAIVDDFNRAFDPQGTKGLAKVYQMARPGMAHIRATGGLRRAKVFRPPRGTRIPSGMNASQYLALMDRYVKGTPAKQIRSGAFIMRTRTGNPTVSAAARFPKAGSEGAGRAITLLAKRVRAKRLPVTRLARIYAVPKQGIDVIAARVLPTAYPEIMTSTLETALRKARYPSAS